MPGKTTLSENTAVNTVVFHFQQTNTKKKAPSLLPCTVTPNVLSRRGRARYRYSYLYNAKSFRESALADGDENVVDIGVRNPVSGMVITIFVFLANGSRILMLTCYKVGGEYYYNVPDIQ